MLVPKYYQPVHSQGDRMSSTPENGAVYLPKPQRVYSKIENAFVRPEFMRFLAYHFTVWKLPRNEIIIIFPIRQNFLHLFTMERSKNSSAYYLYTCK